MWIQKSSSYLKILNFKRSGTKDSFNNDIKPLVWVDLCVFVLFMDKKLGGQIAINV